MRFPLRLGGENKGWRWLASAVFVAAGVGKMLASPRVGATAFITEGWSLWTQRAAQGIERAVPGLELLVAVAFLLGYGARAASIVGASLACVFLVVALVAPAGYECDCFGVIGGFASRPAHVAVALCTLGLSVLAGRSKQGARSVAPS